MFLKGIKRKFSEPGEEPVSSGEQAPATSPAASRTLSSSYSLQRQSLLDMSLIKLQLCHMLVEPNLCRSVLIANTVRQIQEEMTQDGTWQMMTQALAAAQCPADRLVATEVLCRQTDAATQAGQSPKPMSSASYLEADEDHLSADSRTGEKVFGTFEIKHPVPPPDPGLEELFSDVDPSYYDLDTVLTGTPKMGPYDLLESGGLQSCLMDLNELDHIIEILVKS
uniref:Cell division cycle associated 4 n=1 Tax=Kryptolebias marmoratus TaxID=37003 RepID=A0A3Q3AVW1_KRYMA